jgi:hypothetical protein
VLHVFSSSKGAKWVKDPIKDLRMVWQGLFFSKYKYLFLTYVTLVFWHADKSVYQREVAQKMVGVLKVIGDNTEEKLTR